MKHQLPSYSPLSLTGLIGAAGREGVAPGASRAELEALLTQRHEARAVALFGSGTQALDVAIRLAVARSPGPIALPAYSCFDVLTAAVGSGVSVLFYDVEPSALVPDPDGVREVLRRGARSVVAGYLFGFPIDWPSVRAECDAVGATLIEDAAQGIGAGWAGRGAGGHGDLAVLSFGRGKGWTGGCGGALMVHDPSFVEGLAALASGLDEGGRRGMKTAAALGAQWMFGRPALYAIPSHMPGLRLGETVYKEPVPATPMPPLACAVALRHAPAAEREVGARRQGAAEWQSALGERADVPPLASVCTPLGGGTCGYLRYPIRLQTRADADRVVPRAHRFGIARGYPSILPSLPQAEQVAARGDVRTYPGARSLADRLITLPTHSLVPSGSRSPVVARLVAAIARGSADGPS